MTKPSAACMRAATSGRKPRSTASFSRPARPMLARMDCSSGPGPAISSLASGGLSWAWLKAAIMMGQCFALTMRPTASHANSPVSPRVLRTSSRACALDW